MTGSTIRLTMAQALARWLTQQFTEIDGVRVPLFAGVFAIFGHGNVTCFSEALEAVQDRLPTWRGQNEQSMALAAVAFAKAKRRRQIMIAATSIGPGALNMVTAAGTAHANRLPVLLISGDSFTNRLPDPVMQQVEHFGDPTITVNDAFKAVTRYWDRITHPAQIISSLPQAVAAMLDPADCGPAFLALPQDTQEFAFDYPEVFFEPRLWTVPRPRPDRSKLAEAAALVRTAKRPLLIAGGGVRYSLAEKAVGDFAVKHGIPIVETIAGKGGVTHDHPAHAGPIGIIGSTSANALAGEADIDPRRGHAADGLHHGLVDGVQPGRALHLDQRGPVRRRETPRARGSRRRPGDHSGARRRARLLARRSTASGARQSLVQGMGHFARCASRPEQRAAFRPTRRSCTP